VLHIGYATPRPPAICDPSVFTYCRSATRGPTVSKDRGITYSGRPWVAETRIWPCAEPISAATSGATAQRRESAILMNPSRGALGHKRNFSAPAGRLASVGHQSCRVADTTDTEPCTGQRLGRRSVGAVYRNRHATNSTGPANPPPPPTCN